jgi:hypothetical protein
MHVSPTSDDKARHAGRTNDEAPDEGHTRGAKKARRLARTWPLLTDGQDPEGLEARVAFHLHRTGFLGKRLAASSFLSRPHLQSLTQGRLAISAGEVAELAKKLGIPPRQLLRPLTPGEAALWAFYRTSARHRLHVWRRAQACWQFAGISARLAAAIMRIRIQNVAQAIDGGSSGRVLAREPAERLADALYLSAGPETFLMFAGQMLPPEHKIKDVVAPLTMSQLKALKTQHSRADSRHANDRE